MEWKKAGDQRTYWGMAETIVANLRQLPLEVQRSKLELWATGTSRLADQPDLALEEALLQYSMTHLRTLRAVVAQAMGLERPG